jgi:hypothetical protein
MDRLGKLQYAHLFAIASKPDTKLFPIDGKLGIRLPTFSLYKSHASLLITVASKPDAKLPSASIIKTNDTQ